MPFWKNNGLNLIIYAPLDVFKAQLAPLQRLGEVLTKLDNSYI